MTPSETVNEQTRKEWNTLGFYYTRNDENASWEIVGAKGGIMKFCKLLEDYSSDESKRSISEDKHFGPYSYLKFMTWDKPMIAKREIRGRLDDFKVLSEIIKRKLEDSKSSFQVDKEFSRNNEYIINFIIKDKNFEPASADQQLTNK